MGKPQLAFFDDEVSLSPVLKWAGGKRWLLPILRPYFEPFRKVRMVEPFVGGMAVTLGLLPKQALLSDANPHLINFYRWVANNFEISFEMKNNRQVYDSLRARFNKLIKIKKETSKEAAGIFYYLNRTGFNGLCRFNSAGYFNVPFGKYTTINYRKSFSEYSTLFKKWKFESSDFEKLKLKNGDFIYADPPYDVPFTKYSKTDFTWDDQIRLAHWLKRHRGPVIASNQATPRILELYSTLKFSIQIVSAPRMISCTGDRTRAKEMLALLNI